MTPHHRIDWRGLTPGGVTLVWILSTIVVGFPMALSGGTGLLILILLSIAMRRTAPEPQMAPGLTVTAYREFLVEANKAIETIRELAAKVADQEDQAFFRQIADSCQSTLSHFTSEPETILTGRGAYRVAMEEITEVLNGYLILARSKAHDDRLALEETKQALPEILGYFGTINGRVTRNERSQLRLRVGTIKGLADAAAAASASANLLPSGRGTVQ